MRVPLRFVHPAVADEIAFALERRADGFHLTDQEEEVRLRKLVKALRAPDDAGDWRRYDYESSFSVEGRYPFPIDLLREYACVPATPQDSRRLYGLYDDPTTPARIALTRLTQCRFDRCQPPVAGYREAFEAAGWRIVGDGR